MSRGATIYALVLLTACGSGSGPVEPGPTSAFLELSTVTTGSPADPDGYLLILDDGTGTPMGANASFTVRDVAAGEHRLQMTGVAANCLLAGANPRSVVVAAGDTARIRFDVACSPTTGELRVDTRTSGTRPDPDGYVVTVNGTAYPIGSNAELAVTAVPPGDVEVRLDGIAENCLVGGANPVTVTVAPGRTTTATFLVSCAPSADGRFLVVSDQDGKSRLYLLQENGTDLRVLTPSRQAYAGDWSPDGARIVFSGAGSDDAELFVMNADGSGLVRLGIEGSGPRWSPDGRTIAFTSTEGITLVDPDGANRRILGEGSHPDWSPDGTTVVFDRTDRSRCVFDLACPVELYFVNPDGTNERRLARVNDISDSMTNPRWSPDGSAIAYTRRCCFLGPDATGLYVMPASGGLAHRIYPGSVRGGAVWSPDGSSLATAVVGPKGTTDILVVPRAGGRETQLLATPGSDIPQAWR